MWTVNTAQCLFLYSSNWRNWSLAWISDFLANCFMFCIFPCLFPCNLPCLHTKHRKLTFIVQSNAEYGRINQIQVSVFAVSVSTSEGLKVEGRNPLSTGFSKLRSSSKKISLKLGTYMPVSRQDSLCMQFLGLFLRDLRLQN